MGDSSKSLFLVLSLGPLDTDEGYFGSGSGVLAAIFLLVFSLIKIVKWINFGVFAHPPPPPITINNNFLSLLSFTKENAMFHDKVATLCNTYCILYDVASTARTRRGGTSQDRTAQDESMLLLHINIHRPVQ